MVKKKEAQGSWITVFSRYLENDLLMVSFALTSRIVI